ncbi:hypothetical protein CW751_10440 [Brumimicrobium salinarum]|uniref:Uncharacterized protein n=2 Tax=Brumimicrobium salinarum TaxID=2058658 RepID=A0A2I0R112_9FLAO|nr:hypothetical protein CW751_10440 [Brumimicrobium salinarum]
MSFGQTVPPITNQASPEEKQEELQQNRVNTFDSQALSVRQIEFQENVNAFYSGINAINYSSTRKTPTSQQKQQLNKQLKTIEKIDSESFEYHLFKYKLGNYDFSKINHLKKAAELKPHHQEVLKEFSAFSYINGNERQLRKYLKLYSQFNYKQDEFYVMARNVLLSMPKNTYLITHGENDTYPILIEQKIKNIRPDVEIISLDHLQSEDFREKLKKQGFKMPKKLIIDTAFFDVFMHLNKTKNIVVAPSVPRSYIEKGEEITSMGLGFALFSNPQKDYNRMLYEQTMRKQITEHINNSRENAPIMSNYLPFLLKVRNEYNERNDIESLQEIEHLILEIARLSNKQNQVNRLLNK